MKKMTTDQIRQTWLDYFQSKGHTIIPSKSLIPVNDPSLLWINSGVATLKSYFSGVATPPSKRLVNSQRAIRTNDIENVGVTARHHTFFEMLGNFSIGDYFKKEAIEMAYELLTKYYGIDPNALYITVYQDDVDALKTWLAQGIKKDHIVKGNKTRNFWDIGQGPCGPCTEIYFDRGEKYDPTRQGAKLFVNDIENDRYVEIWNIVFSQFNNDGKNNYTELTRKNIDTGAGLERLACISQDKHTDFDTDAFVPIIKHIESLTAAKYDPNIFFDKQSPQFLINKDFKIITDHIKACTFAIADGALPSGKDRGYVLRKLIRRAMISGRRLEIGKKFLGSVAKSAVQSMSNSYPYLGSNEANIVTILEKEESLFLTTLDNGYKLFESSIKNGTIDTETLFKLVDTYGFPFEIINELAITNKVKIDAEAFNKRFQQHQVISRSSADVKGMLSQNADLVSLEVKSTFDYEHLEMKDVKVVACFDENFKFIKQLNGKGWLVFDKTIFYATSGGQLHDVGQIVIDRRKYDVIDVIKAPNRQHLHLINSDVAIKIGDEAHLIVDQQNRLNASRNHSVEHLIQHALQTVIDEHIKQEGAFKSGEKVSFDYHYHSKLTDQQVVQVQAKVNEYIQSGFNVQTKIMSLDEAKKAGAIAYFEDTYSKLGNDLRVVCMGDVSMEICGGTHVNKTSDIEQFLIIKIDNKGSGSWRLEGITSNATIDKYIKHSVDELKTKTQILQSKTDDPKSRSLIKQMKFTYSLDGLKQLRQQYLELDEVFNATMYQHQKANAVNELNKIKTTAKETSISKNVYYFTVRDVESKTLSKALSEIIDMDKSHAYIALNNYRGKLQYVIIASQDFVTKYKFNANQVIQQINKLSNGSGGGRNEFAQGGTTNADAESTILDLISKM